MAIGITGVTASSFSNLQLDAGVFLEKFDYTESTTLKELIKLAETAITGTGCLGATSGGMTFSSAPEIRSIELDGMRQDFKGSYVKDKTVISIETTLTEVTSANLRRILCASEIKEIGTAETGTITKVRERLNIDITQDYIDKLTWIGDLLDGRLAVITLFNCINTNGTTWIAADKGNATFPVTFTATNSSFADKDYAPYEIIIFGKAPETVTTP